MSSPLVVLASSRDAATRAHARRPGAGALGHRPDDLQGAVRPPQGLGDIEALLRFGKVDEQQVVRWLSTIVGPDDDRLGRFTALLREVARPGGDVPVAAVLFGRRKPRLGD